MSKLCEMLWCIKNAYVNIQSKYHVPKFIPKFLRVAPKTKINFLENRFCVKIPGFP